MNELSELQQAEVDLYELSSKVAKLRAESEPKQVKDYMFKDLNGDVSLSELFGNKDTLFLIHNMGQGCRYCTLWADGLNGFVPHIESSYSLALVSKDTPEIQQSIANDRGWRFRMASHAGGEYIHEQTVMSGQKNMPGVVCYVKKGSNIYRKNAAVFGPGDEFCAQWRILSLAGVQPDDWTPQFHYWHRPDKLEDGGENIVE